jgi:hypothetical protein
VTRTDTRGLAERKISVTLRISELRLALRAAERTAAEIDTLIENAERARESGDRAAE